MQVQAIRSAPAPSAAPHNSTESAAARNVTRRRRIDAATAVGLGRLLKGLERPETRERVPARWVKTPVWAEDAENEAASGSRVEMKPLVGISRHVRELSAHGIQVSGLRPFVAGKGPRDKAATATQYHDSFTQAVVFSALSQLRATFDRLDIGMKLSDVAALTHGKVLRASVNAERYPGGYYDRRKETLVFGTTGSWDAGADVDIVIHEAGHWILDALDQRVDYGGERNALGEGYSDAQAALFFGDPEMFESQPLKVDEKRAKADGYRNVSVSTTLERAGDLSHRRGVVYSGIFWQLGETLHEQLMGKPRARGRDTERLAPKARDEALKILWTMPRFLEGRLTPGKIVDGIDAAITELASKGRFDSGVDPKALHAQLGHLARERGITR